MGARVVIVDDHQLLAESLRVSLALRGMSAKAVEPHGHLVDAVRAEHPELVLLDLDLGRAGDGTPLIGPLTQHPVRVVVVTGLPDRLRIAAALEAGAVGYRSKADGLDALVDTAAAALAGPVPLDLPTRAALLDELRRDRCRRAALLEPFQSLTEREEETLRFMSRGLTVREIAADWVVSEATVRTHVHGVLSKLDVRSQLAAVAAALRAGWLDGVEPTVGSHAAETG